MHRRDYIVVAKVLRKMKKDTHGVVECEATVNTTIDEFCKAFKTEASSFNEEKFRSFIEKGE